MKKIVSLMFAAAALFATSCQNDRLETVQMSNDTQVAFAINLDGFAATRAAETMNADRLVYALFDADGNLITEIGEDGMVVKNNAFASGSENISVSLVKGQTYSIVFWAQNSDCDAYTIAAEPDGLKVDVDYNGLNNDEGRDAYFASQSFTVGEAETVDVYLKRPFAQINLGVTHEDWAAAIASGLNITESKAVIKNAATSINLLDGSVSGETVVTYESAAIPSVETRASSSVKNLVVNDQSYKWLSMSYILTDESKSTLDSDGLEFTLKTEDGQSFVLSEGLHNVPVQRNWRTNVVGAVLTGETDFNVSVDPIYFSTATIPAGDVAAFKAALADRNVQVIKLAYGVYDGVFLHNTIAKTIESEDPANPAVIRGVLGVAAPVEFNNLKFIPSANSQLETGHQYIDRMARKSVVPIYAAKATFTNCDFEDLYNSHQVVAINYQAHRKGTMLEIDNCSFQGYAYALYSRALLSITNSTFDLYHSQVNPRTIFLYGLGDGSQGHVIFKNNTAVGKQQCYVMEMSSANYDYRNIHFNVQDNVNFAVDGVSLLCHPDRDFTGCTYEEGSAEITF